MGVAAAGAFSGEASGVAADALGSAGAALSAAGVMPRGERRSRNGPARLQGKYSLPELIW